MVADCIKLSVNKQRHCIHIADGFNGAAALRKTDNKAVNQHTGFGINNGNLALGGTVHNQLASFDLNRAGGSAQSQ